MNNQFQFATAVAITDQLIAAVEALVSTDLKAVPNDFHDFVDGNPVLRQFILIKLEIELARVELLPIDHGT